MADLNLDGLPALKAILSEAQGGDSHSASVFGEIRRLVERECYGNGLEDGRDRLPDWAKLVMRAVRELACSEPLSDDEDECCDKVREIGERLTYLKEIGIESLPYWAKHVMRAAVRFAGCGGDRTMAELDDDLVRAVDALTEAQLKEIGEDDG